MCIIPSTVSIFKDEKIELQQDAALLSELDLKIIKEYLAIPYSMNMRIVYQLLQGKNNKVI